MSRYKPLKSLKTAFFAFLLCFTVGQTAIAGIAPTPCDPQYYDSLRSRAWLEAQREITQNQNLIFKPDSVMEYTCFDRYMNILAYEAQNMFSETTRWGTILNTNSMDNALQNLVGSALNTYITANFGHSFLGGRTPMVATGMMYTVGTISGAPATSYVCNSMRDVWRESKCMDFIQNQTTDGFYTFENYRTTADKRTLPTACNNAGLPARWGTEMGLSTVNATTPWIEDNVNTFYNLLDPAACGNTTLRIETGITVQRSKATPTTYREKACIPAGCHYVPTNVNAGTCAP